MRGGGLRRPLGVMDRFFFDIPILKSIASYISQSDRALSAVELTEQFMQSENVDLVIFPEGSNCFFGRPEDIKEFKSPKFVEIAVRAETPILLSVHRGSEEWGKSIDMNQDRLSQLRSATGVFGEVAFQFANKYLKIEERLEKSGLFTIPSFPKPMPSFDMLCELYQPKLKLNDIEGLSKEELRPLLDQESQKIRARMEELLGELDSMRAKAVIAGSQF
jgi:hypothetical protein